MARYLQYSRSDVFRDANAFCDCDWHDVHKNHLKGSCVEHQYTARKLMRSRPDLRRAVRDYFRVVGNYRRTHETRRKALCSTNSFKLLMVEELDVELEEAHYQERRAMLRVQHEEHEDWMDDFCSGDYDRRCEEYARDEKEKERRGELQRTQRQKWYDECECEYDCECDRGEDWLTEYHRELAEQEEARERRRAYDQDWMEDFLNGEFDDPEDW